VLLTVGGIDGGVEVGTIPVTLDLAQGLEGLAESDDISFLRNGSGGDGREEAKEDHTDGQEEGCRAKHCFGLAFLLAWMRRCRLLRGVRIG